jgi:hypothetical protein
MEDIELTPKCGPSRHGRQPTHAPAHTFLVVSLQYRKATECAKNHTAPERKWVLVRFQKPVETPGPIDPRLIREQPGLCLNKLPILGWEQLSGIVLLAFVGSTKTQPTEELSHHP